MRLLISLLRAKRKCPEWVEFERGYPDKSYDTGWRKRRNEYWRKSRLGSMGYMGGPDD